MVRPESKPAGVLFVAAKYVQGAPKDDCDTECAKVEAGKKKVTMVPFEAVILLGLNVKLPFGATSILICPLVDGGAEGTVAGAVEVAAVPEPLLSGGA